LKVSTGGGLTTLEFEEGWGGRAVSNEGGRVSSKGVMATLSLRKENQRGRIEGEMANKGELMRASQLELFAWAGEIFEQVRKNCLPFEKLGKYGCWDREESSLLLGLKVTT